MVTFSRTNAPLNLIKGGEVVGRIFHSSTKTRKYILDINGLFWNRGHAEPNSNHGSPGMWFKTLTAAKEAAKKYT